MQSKTLKWVNTVSYLATVAVNGLADLLRLGGVKTGEVTDKYPNLFTPAPITFAIWGVIYLLLAVFVLYQWGIFDRGRYSDGIRERIGLWFAASSAFNIAWIFAWHYDAIGLSLVCMAGLLVTLIGVVTRLDGADGNFVSWLCARAGFEVYFGWIIAATISNVSVWLTKIGWNGFGLTDPFWTVLILLIGADIAAAVVLLKHGWLAGLTVIWAYAGVLIRHLSPAYYGGLYRSVIVAAIAAIAVIVCSIVLMLCHRKGGADSAKEKRPQANGGL